MKLYATVTSERATKGQGGKELEIDIMNEKKAIVCSLSVNVDEYRQITLTLNGYDNKNFFFDRFPCDNCQENTEIKGEKQKGEVCNELISDNGILGETRCKRINCTEHE